MCYKAFWLGWTENGFGERAAVNSGQSDLFTHFPIYPNSESIDLARRTPLASGTDVCERSLAVSPFCITMRFGHGRSPPNHRTTSDGGYRQRPGAVDDRRWRLGFVRRRRRSRIARSRGGYRRLEHALLPLAHAHA